MIEQRNDTDVREILRLIAVIRNKEYQRGWRDAVSAMKTAVENIQHAGPVAETPTPAAETSAPAAEATTPAATTPEGDGRVRYMEAAPSSGETPDAEQQESPTIRDVGQR